MCVSASPLQLSGFETDLKRSAAMSGRRVHLLAPLLGSLNPAIYIVSHKELSIEGAWLSHHSTTSSSATNKKQRKPSNSQCLAPVPPFPAADASQDVFNLKLLRLEQKVQAGGVATAGDLQAVRVQADVTTGLYAHFLR